MKGVGVCVWGYVGVRGVCVGVILCRGVVRFSTSSGQKKNIYLFFLIPLSFLQFLIISLYHSS